MQKNNSIWRFFASVKLALVTIFFITVTSIIGTVIPQKESIEWYASRYGPKTAQFFDVLDIPNMYSSWWFTALLFLLCFNLIICSIDRFPAVWKQVKMDGLAFSPARLTKMSNQQTWSVSGSAATLSNDLATKLKSLRWPCKSKTTDQGILFFSQKGAWTRTGVYMVHASILIIFTGAVIGYLFGFKGSVSIPETTMRDRVVLFGSGEIIELGFQVRCNSFAIELYPNGMPKEYTSSLTVLENGEEIFTREIEVNSPLKYKGITFYQSSYEAYQDFLINITNTETGREKSFIVPFQQQSKWPEEGLSFGIINAKAIGQSIVSSKIWFSDDQGTPSSEWVDDGKQVTFKSQDRQYQVRAKQMYATGLQVAKDPGVWWVYFGCLLMLFGLYVAFFMSHRRIWLLISDTPEGAKVLLAGSANKNRPGFERVFDEIATKLQV